MPTPKYYGELDVLSVVPFFQCHFCEFQTQEQQELSRHVTEIHPEPNISNCPDSLVCGECFEDFNDLQEHLLEDHFHIRDIPLFEYFATPIYYCYNCDYRTLDQFYMELHMIEEHEEQIDMENDHPNRILDLFRDIVPEPEAIAEVADVNVPSDPSSESTFSIPNLSDTPVTTPESGLEDIAEGPDNLPVDNLQVDFPEYQAAAPENPDDDNDEPIPQIDPGENVHPEENVNPYGETPEEVFRQIFLEAVHDIPRQGFVYGDVVIPPRPPGPFDDPDEE